MSHGILIIGSPVSKTYRLGYEGTDSGTCLVDAVSTMYTSLDACCIETPSVKITKAARKTQRQKQLRQWRKDTKWKSRK